MDFRPKLTVRSTLDSAGVTGTGAEKIKNKPFRICFVKSKLLPVENFELKPNSKVLFCRYNVNQFTPDCQPHI